MREAVAPLSSSQQGRAKNRCAALPGHCAPRYRYRARSTGLLPSGTAQPDLKTPIEYSLPDLKLIGHTTLPEVKNLGGAPSGSVPEWITFTPDGRTVYVSNSADRSVSAIDTETLKQVARIPVGEVPKRINTLSLP